ncbi:MAG TPA: GNAT family N-acetyltransferase [Candidatus Acidoferrales bacterium]|nr:GNAT family N-acetyltransferase [Candidatus Acidoferrales bacterium]
MARIFQHLSAPPADLELCYGQVSLCFDKVVPGDAALGFVPYYHFRILLADSCDAGRINFRVGDTDHITFIAGHIGYEVTPPFRGHSYALQACRALAPFVRSFYPSVIITTNPDNLPSVRTIEKLGAVFMDEVPIPPHDPHYLRGSRTKLRYRWNP